MKRKYISKWPMLRCLEKILFNYDINIFGKAVWQTALFLQIYEIIKIFKDKKRRFNKIYDVWLKV